jgi:predicted RNA-binding Zn ribbon-like protein
VERFGPTRRGGPVFRWLGQPLAIDFTNTVMVVRESEEVDLLATPQDLDRWLEAQQERLGDCRFAIAHLDEIRALRDSARKLLRAAVEGVAPPREALDHLNAASAAAPVSPQLALGEPRVRLEERAGAGDPLARLLGLLARSTIMFLTETERVPLQICRAPSCGMFYLGARRWCCSACGNRARAAKHYRRSRGKATPQPRSR